MVINKALTTWQEVYDDLGITKEVERLHLMILRRREVLLCSLAEASDLVEFERNGTPNHCQAMKRAVDAGECGHILDIDDLLEIHAYMFTWGGDWRSCDVLIPQSTHMFPSYYHVPVLMRHYIEDSIWWLTCSTDDPYVILAHLHLEFERIHPFRDGNGRMGRILLNNHAAYLNLPFIRITLDDRNEYLDCLENKDEQGLARLFMTCSI
jgi:Fic family protein